MFWLKKECICCLSKKFVEFIESPHGIQELQLLHLVGETGVLIAFTKLHFSFQYTNRKCLEFFLGTVQVVTSRICEFWVFNLLFVCLVCQISLLMELSIVLLQETTSTNTQHFARLSIPMDRFPLTVEVTMLPQIAHKVLTLKLELLLCYFRAHRLRSIHIVKHQVLRHQEKVLSEINR